MASKQIQVAGKDSSVLTDNSRVVTIVKAPQQQKQESVFSTLPPLALACTTTAFAMYPVDVIRALRMTSASSASNISTIQLLTNFKNAHGYGGFLKQGVLPEASRATWMRISKFFMFPIAHEFLFDTKPSHGTAYTKACAGALATIPEVLSIVPMEIAKLGLQIDNNNHFKNSGRNVIKTMVETNGIKGAYTGIFGLQVRQALWTSAYFSSLGSFEHYIKKSIGACGIDNTSTTVAKISQISSGFMAGVFGAMFNIPADVIRSVQQKRAISEVIQNKHNVDQIVIIREKFSPSYVSRGVSDFFVIGKEIVAGPAGVRALWSGFTFKALHLGGSGALLAVLIPTFKDAMGVIRE